MTVPIQHFVHSFLLEATTPNSLTDSKNSRSQDERKYLASEKGQPSLMLLETEVTPPKIYLFQYLEISDNVL